MGNDLNRKQVFTYIHIDLFKRLLAVCRDSGRTPSDVIRKYIAEGLDRVARTENVSYHSESNFSKIRDD